jgi:uncharacterized LabA/DUF88 family protein
MPVIKQPEQRVGIFIDTQNMYHSARDLYNARVNFGKLVEEAVGDRRLVRAIAYVISTAGGEEKPFFEALKHAGIETREKDLQIFYGGGKKADWDVGLAVDAIRISPLLDVVIIVSGDGDFIPLVEYLKNHGLQVEVAAFRNTTATKLVEAADAFTDLAEAADNILIQPKNDFVKKPDFVKKEYLAPRPPRAAAKRIAPGGTAPSGRRPITDF